MSNSVLIFPGIGNSGQQHWQSLWEQSNPEFVRVYQRDWNNPVCEEWVAALETATKHAGPNSVIVAHSLACLVVAHWASKEHAPIKAAMLVAVPDPLSPNFPNKAIGFATTPTKQFGFRSVVVASTNDPYGTTEYASHLSKKWGSDFVNIGSYGHISANSGIGVWQEGFEILSQLRR